MRHLKRSSHLNLHDYNKLNRIFALTYKLFCHPWLQALLLISTATAAKDKTAKEAAFKVLACCALQYKQLEHLVATLADMLNKDEHMSVVCAELAQYAAKHLGNNQLVCHLCTCMQEPTTAASTSLIVRLPGWNLCRETLVPA